MGAEPVAPAAPPLTCESRSGNWKYEAAYIMSEQAFISSASAQHSITHRETVTCSLICSDTDLRDAPNSAPDCRRLGRPPADGGRRGPRGAERAPSGARPRPWAPRIGRPPRPRPRGWGQSMTRASAGLGQSARSPNPASIAAATGGFVTHGVPARRKLVRRAPAKSVYCKKYPGGEKVVPFLWQRSEGCLLYTSDAADE